MFVCRPQRNSLFLNATCHMFGRSFVPFGIDASIWFRFDSTFVVNGAALAVTGNSLILVENKSVDKDLS